MRTTPGLRDCPNTGFLALLATTAAAGINLYAQRNEPIEQARRVPAIAAQVDQLRRACGPAWSRSTSMGFRNSCAAARSSA